MGNLIHPGWIKPGIGYHGNKGRWMVNAGTRLQWITCYKLCWMQTLDPNSETDWAHLIKWQYLASSKWDVESKSQIMRPAWPTLGNELARAKSRRIVAKRAWPHVGSFRSGLESCRIMFNTLLVDVIHKSQRKCIGHHQVVGYWCVPIYFQSF